MEEIFQAILNKDNNVEKLKSCREALVKKQLEVISLRKELRDTRKELRDTRQDAETDKINKVNKFKDIILDLHMLYMTGKISYFWTTKRKWNHFFIRRKRIKTLQTNLETYLGLKLVDNSFVKNSYMQI